MADKKSAIDKLNEARELMTPGEGDTEARFFQGYNIIKKLTRPYEKNKCSVDVKVAAIESVFAVDSQQARDILNSYVNGIHFLDDDLFHVALDVMKKISMRSEIPSYDRKQIANNIFQRANNPMTANDQKRTIPYLLAMEDIFDSLVNDMALSLEERADMSLYLYANGTKQGVSQCTDLHKELISIHSYTEDGDVVDDSEKRYGLIVNFHHRRGVKTFLNMERIPVMKPQESLFYELSRTFYEDEENNIRYRLLAAQSLLQYRIVEEDVKKEVGDWLLDIAKDESLDENCRADAADIVSREAITKPQKLEAIRVISMIGDNTGEGTIYDNSQNVHEFSEQIDTFIKQIVSETDIEIENYETVRESVLELIRENTSTMEDAKNAQKAIHRIDIDTARFTEDRITLQQIFIHVWLRIQQRYSDEEKASLEKRLVEELIEMNDTCASGHSARFINVLSVYDNTLKISWSQQIKANIAGRMNARIRDIEDEELMASVALGLMDGADQVDKDEYDRFVSEQLNEIEDELRGEFVGEYITEAQFVSAFEEGCNRYLLE